MRGATAGRTIHLNQSTTIHTKSATLFIAVRGVAFITIFFLLAVTPSSAQILNGNFSNGLNSWNITYYGDSVSVPTTNKVILYPSFSGMGNASNIYALGGWFNEGEGQGVLARTTVLSQKTDLTGRTTLKFRGYGAGNTGGGYHQSLTQSYFSIDGVFKFFISSNQEYTVDVSSYTGVHNIQFTSYAYGNWYYSSNAPCNTYIDYVRIEDEPPSIPTLPQSSGVISFQNDPYDNIDTVQLSLVEDIIDWQSYDCVGDSCSWQPAYYWNLLEPLFYYQDVPIVRVWEGEYENSSFSILDTNPFIESGVSLVENPYSHVLNYQFTNSKNITSTDAAFLRADFVVRRDWYAWVSFSGWRQKVSSHETIIDSDYAYHTPLANANITPDNPPAVSPTFPQDNTPHPVDMNPDNSTDLPEGTDIDGDGIDDNEDSDDDGNGEDDSNDDDGDGNPDVTDPDDDDPFIAGPVDLPPDWTPPQDTDDDGVDDSVDGDDDGDQIPDDQDPDDDNDGVPDELEGGDQNSTIPDPYQNSTYEGYLPANNSTYTYSVLEGYYSTVDGVFAPIDSGVTGVLGYVTTPVYSLSSSINSVNGYAVSVFSSATVAIQPASLIMEAVFDSMPDKVKGIVSYYILLTLILIILGRSW